MLPALRARGGLSERKVSGICLIGVRGATTLPGVLSILLAACEPLAGILSGAVGRQRGAWDCKYREKNNDFRKKEALRLSTRGEWQPARPSSREPK